MNPTRRWWRRKDHGRRSSIKRIQRVHVFIYQYQCIEWDDWVFGVMCYNGTMVWHRSTEMQEKIKWDKESDKKNIETLSESIRTRMLGYICACTIWFSLDFLFKNGAHLEWNWRFEYVTQFTATKHCNCVSFMLIPIFRYSIFPMEWKLHEMCHCAHRIVEELMFIVGFTFWSKQ